MENLEKVVRTSCRGCHGICQVLVHVDAAGQIGRITGDKDSPTSRGYICPKGVYAGELLYHPDRLRVPLKRKKGRGEGVWEEISWNEATDMIAARFSEIRENSGPEYISIAQGTGRPYTEFTNRFCRAMGSPNLLSPGFNCFLPRTICAGITLGWYPRPDIYGFGGAMPACIMVMGNNITETGASDGYCGYMVKQAMKKASKTIVIDPRRTAQAGESDMHLALRPGTDCALMLAMIHTVIEENVYDAAFVEAYCGGFEELKKHVMSFTPEWAEKITRVPAALIKEAALTFARCRPAALVWGNGVDESISAFQTVRAVYIFLALCGTLDVPGGMVDWVPPSGLRPKSTLVDRNVGGWEFITPEQQAKVISDYPFCPGPHPPAFWKSCIEGHPYKPKAIWLVGTNPVLTQTGGELIREALKNHLEFVVSSDFFMTPTAALSDLVLPAQHWLEQEDIVYLNKIWCALARPKITQVGDARDDREVILEVARKMGLYEAFPWETWRAYLEWILEPSGLSLEEFMEKGIVTGEMRYRKYEGQGFKTPSGKVELFSRVMASKGLAPLPVYAEPPVSPVSTPDLAEKYPYILISGCKVLPYFHTAGRQLPSLRSMRPYPQVQMHPATADRAGLKNGISVKVSTIHNSQEFILTYDDRLPEDTVQVDHAWWYPEEKGPEYGCFKSNVNLLFAQDHFDPHSGAESLKSYLCTVEAVR